MNLDPTRFSEAAHEALHDENLKPALARLKSHFALGRRLSVRRFANFEEMRETGRAIRDHAITHLDELLERFEKSVTGRGGHVHWARDAEEGRAIVLKILTEVGATTVTKGKSMVTEEIELNPWLEKNGIVPVETDLGEYIIQLRKEPPSHIIAPAFHLSKEQVADTFRAAHTTLDPARPLSERNALVAEARRMLRAKFESADAGITGANFLSAEEGAAVIVTNEGNGDLTRLLPKTHIVVTGIEKVVPDLNDVAVLLRLLTRSATGQEISSYVSVMTAPLGRAGDGPKNFHVVLVDNGRSKLVGTEAQDVLRCIRCSACLNHCPIYGAIGGHAYGATYSGPIGAALNPGMLGVAKAHHHPNASTFCGRCAEVCPVKIPLPKIMRYWRAREYADGLAPRASVMGIGLWAFAAKRPALYRLGASIAARALKFFAGKNGAVRSLPLMKGWFLVRDFPAPRGKTFHELWRASPSPRGRVEKSRSEAKRFFGEGNAESASPTPENASRFPTLPQREGGATPPPIKSGATLPQREGVLANIRARKLEPAPKPERYLPAAIAEDFVARFTERAGWVNADIRTVERLADVPAAVAELLRAKNMAASVHLPADAELNMLPWGSTLEIKREAPGPDDAAVAVAPFAIAETGTLVYPARANSPAAWHFRPGFEIAILRAGTIAPHLEEVLARIKETGPIPHTINLVTGPSRTGDIEQTLELGAHGPKNLAILIVKE